MATLITSNQYWTRSFTQYNKQIKKYVRLERNKTVSIHKSMIVYEDN